MYFKVGRKVQLFGICCDSNNIQVDYLVDESETIGKNGTKSHGANSVISMLDHYFNTHSLKKNQYVTAMQITVWVKTKIWLFCLAGVNWEAYSNSFIFYGSRPYQMVSQQSFWFNQEIL